MALASGSWSHPRALPFETLPARQTAGGGWAWVEVEDFIDRNPQRNVDRAKAA